MNKRFYIGVVFVVVLLLISYICILPKNANLGTVNEPTRALTKEQKEVKKWLQNESSKPRPKTEYHITFKTNTSSTSN